MIEKASTQSGGVVGYRTPQATRPLGKAMFRQRLKGHRHSQTRSALVVDLVPYFREITRITAATSCSTDSAAITQQWTPSNDKTYPIA